MTNDYCFYDPEAHQELDLKISVSDLGMLRNDTHIFDSCVSKIDGFVKSLFTGHCEEQSDKAIS